MRVLPEMQPLPKKGKKEKIGPKHLVSNPKRDGAGRSPT